MLSVGETLKRARLEQGLDLSTVAAQTKISARYLEAIESDDRKRLPSGFFYKSFVEQYARSLSVDTQEIDAEIDRVLSADEPLPLPGFESVVARNVPPITFARRFHTRRLYTSAATLVLVLAACSGVYAWWREARSSLTVRGVHNRVQRMMNTAVKPAAVQAKPAVAMVKVPNRASGAAPRPANEAENVPVAAPSEFNAPSEYKVMLDLMAHETTWLSVSSDGKPVFSGILQANQSKTVGGREFAKVRVGNAAGLEVRLNGRLLGPLGARGQVLTVLFTPDNFQIFSPPKESD
jgi:transcriptional regulator with XRE-family HTH domain